MGPGYLWRAVEGGSLLETGAFISEEKPIGDIVN